MIVRPAVAADHDAVWRVMEPVISAGETYALPRDMSRQAALAYWFAAGHEVGVCATPDGQIAGTYYLRANHAGGGAHVANAAFMTAAGATGQGVGRSMAARALARAKERGFLAMQFNFVVASNTRAVALWRLLGFGIVGTLPGAFKHPRLGFVDAYVMHRPLT